jgi:cyanophycin synthetase
VKALVAEEIREGGSVVLNADDPVTVALADRAAVRRRQPVIRFFSLTPGSPVIERHRQAGGPCYEIIEGQLTETEGGQRRPLIGVAELPGAFGGRARHVLANALAAVAACRAAGISAKDIRQGLLTFTPEAANPGRGNIYRAGSSPVILDYGHNAAALAATGQFIADVWGGDPVAAVTLPGDRRDDLLAQTAAAIAGQFGTVVLYEDSDKRGRDPGEMTALIGAALRQARPGIRCEEAENPADALRAALAMAGGAPVLFLYEKLAIAHDALLAVGALPWPEASSPDPSGAGLTVPAAAAPAGPAPSMSAPATPPIVLAPDSTASAASTPAAGQLLAGQVTLTPPGAPASGCGVHATVTGARAGTEGPADGDFVCGCQPYGS